MVVHGLECPERHKDKKVVHGAMLPKSGGPG